MAQSYYSRAFVEVRLYRARGTEPTAAERWPHDTAKPDGEEDADVASTDDWRAALST